MCHEPLSRRVNLVAGVNSYFCKCIAVVLRRITIAGVTLPSMACYYIRGWYRRLNKSYRTYKCHEPLSRRVNLVAGETSYFYKCIAVVLRRTTIAGVTLASMACYYIRSRNRRENNSYRTYKCHERVNVVAGETSYFYKCIAVVLRRTTIAGVTLPSMACYYIRSWNRRENKSYRTYKCHEPFSRRVNVVAGETSYFYKCIAVLRRTTIAGVTLRSVTCYYIRSWNRRENNSYRTYKCHERVNLVAGETSYFYKCIAVVLRRTTIAGVTLPSMACYYIRSRNRRENKSYRTYSVTSHCAISRQVNLVACFEPASKPSCGCDVLFLQMHCSCFKAHNNCGCNATIYGVLL